MNDYQKYALAIIKRAFKEIDYRTVMDHLDDETDGYFHEDDAVNTCEVVADAEAVLMDWFDSMQDGLRY